MNKTPCEARWSGAPDDGTGPRSWRLTGILEPIARNCGASIDASAGFSRVQSPRPPRYSISETIPATAPGAVEIPRFLVIVSSHDDLQAVVAALTAMAFMGGPALPVPEGIEAVVIQDSNGIRRRAEGLIWNVTPVGGPVTSGRLPASSTYRRPPPPDRAAGPSVRVTQAVLDQVAKAANGLMQAQIALRNAGPWRGGRELIRFELAGTEYGLTRGDTTAIWRSHQTPETTESFEELFGLLSDTPDTAVPVTILT